MRSYADQQSISAYHVIYRESYSFLAHPITPCGTLVDVRDPHFATWDPYGQAGFYLGPSFDHSRAYRCLISVTNSIRVFDSIILYPAPLVVSSHKSFQALPHTPHSLTTPSFRSLTKRHPTSSLYPHRLDTTLLRTLELISSVGHSPTPALAVAPLSRMRISVTGAERHVLLL